MREFGAALQKKNLIFFLLDFYPFERQPLLPLQERMRLTCLDFFNKIWRTAWNEISWKVQSIANEMPIKTLQFARGITETLIKPVILIG